MASTLLLLLPPYFYFYSRLFQILCARHFHLQRWQAEISPSLLMDMLKIKKEAEEEEEEEDPVNQWAGSLVSTLAHYKHTVDCRITKE